MSLHYYVKYECQKTGDDLKLCIVINVKSQDSTAKHLSCDELFHYKFIIQFGGERILEIGEHLAKLYKQNGWSCHLDICPQRCRTRQISKITYLWQTENVTDCCYVNKQIDVSLLSTNIKLL